MLGIRWVALGIPWVCQDRAPWARLVLVQVWVLRTLFLGGDVDPTRVDQELSRMGGYWGGILEAKVVMVVCGLLATLGRDMVWLPVELWVVQLGTQG